MRVAAGGERGGREPADALLGVHQPREQRGAQALQVGFQPGSQRRDRLDDRLLDDCLEQLVQVIDQIGGIMIVTADHGNADIMYTEGIDGAITPKTSHTLSPVPFAIHDGSGTAGYRLVDDLPDAGIANVAATTLNLMGLDAPADYEPSLIKPAEAPST